jgi:hypothetical protein
MQSGSVGLDVADYLCSSATAMSKHHVGTDWMHVVYKRLLGSSIVGESSRHHSSVSAAWFAHEHTTARGRLSTVLS